MINPSNPGEWFAANPYLTILKCEFGTACDEAGFIEIVGPNDLGGIKGLSNTPYILDPQNPNELLVGTCRAWRIGTNGTNPQQLSNDFDTLGTGACTGDEINLVDALAAGVPQDTNHNSTVVYAVTNGYGPLSGSPGGEVWVTTNASVSLMAEVTQNINPNGYAISSVAMDQSRCNRQHGYVGIYGIHTSMIPYFACMDDKQFRHELDGLDWDRNDGASRRTGKCFARHSQTGLIYAGTDVGVFVSSTSAASWMEVGPEPGPGTSGFLPNAPVTALQLLS